MTDPTEKLRKQRLAEINAEPGSRESLEAQHGQVWSIEELSQDWRTIVRSYHERLREKRRQGKSSAA